MPIAVVVGATSGIGRALAEVLLDAGYTVGVAGRREELLRELGNAHPGRAVVQVMDLLEPEAAAAGLEALVGRLGGMDLLVVSAGVGARNPGLEFAPDARVVAVNVTGFVALAGFGYRYFAEHGGHLVGISSVAGVRGCRWSPSYGASKAFVANYLEALRARARHDRLPVVVTEIVPGFVDTPMIAGRIDLFWVADADTAARQTYRAIRAGKPRAYVTRRWALVAWLLRHLPDRVLRRL